MSAGMVIGGVVWWVVPGEGTYGEGAASRPDAGWHTSSRVSTAPPTTMLSPGSTEIVLVSERLLIGEAIAAGLVRRGFAPTLLSWPDRRGSIRRIRRLATSGGGLGLLMSGLATPERVRDVGRLVAPGPVRWLVLTDTDPGPRWGMVLEAGATGVLPTSTTFDDMLAAIGAVLVGQPPMDPDLRERVLDEWRDVEADQRELVERMERLTPRETEVLGLLYDGTSVSQIAEASGVAESTVRSQVKAVRKKLGVDSQLAAVATYRRALDTFPRDPPPS